MCCSRVRAKLPQALCGEGAVELHVAGGGRRRRRRRELAARVGGRRVHAQPRLARRLAGKEARAPRHREH